jgi:hypothetical protein
MLVPSGNETQTDAAGTFRFPNVEPADYTVMVTKTGFIPVDGHEDGYRVALTASREKYELRLAPLSSIRGRITDDEGEPVEGVTVLVLRSRVDAGYRRNQVVNTVETNDRGEYRIGLLQAGAYLVKAGGQSSQTPYYSGYAPPPGTREGFAPVYFGGSPDAIGATLLPLQPGVEARADFSVTLQPGHSIRGRITNLKPHSTADLQLSSGDEDLGVTRSSLELVTGKFEIRGVLDGMYRLRVYQRIDDDVLLFAEQNVVLSGHDVEGVTLTLGHAPAVKGKLRIEGKWDKPAVGFSAILDAQDSFFTLRIDQKQRVSGQVADDSFEIPSVLPGKYWASFRTGYGLYVSSAYAGDTDLLSTPELVATTGIAPELDIVLRADGGGLSGTIVDAVGGAAVVVLVPESCNRPAQATRAERDNGFSFSNVAPGSYRLHVWKETAEVEFESPNTRCVLARSGTPVEIKAGDVAKIQLQKLSEEPK